MLSIVPKLIYVSSFLFTNIYETKMQEVSYLFCNYTGRR